jgi:porphobilinogen synthase
MRQRPRRNRATPGIRALVRETAIDPSHLVLPLFLEEGDGEPVAIPAMPGVHRWPLRHAVAQARQAYELGIAGVALFPRVPDHRKTPDAAYALDPRNLAHTAMARIADAVPGLTIIGDVALDPYSSDGHDGLVQDGVVANDPSVALLAAMAVAQAQAGAQVVAPSDMMDGRVGAIRDSLDAAGYTGTLICSYCAKYASAFYGPFRQALDSAPRQRPGVPVGKTTYQMDPANAREAEREAMLDLAEGADWLLVKPGLPYLDVIARLRAATPLPVAAYHVSGEYAALRAAAAAGMLDYEQTLMESLICLRRAGADLILTYGAVDAARLLRRG